MSRLLLVFLFFTLESFSFGHETRFDGYKVHSILPETYEQLKQTKILEDSDLPLNFWKEPQNINVSVDVMVPPHFEAQFYEILTNLGLRAGIMIDNVQRLIDESKPEPETNRREFGWEHYYDIGSINKWLEEISAAHQQHAKVITVGRSYEGRELKGVKISFKEGNKAVFIEGGIHAREWIAPATVTYILNEILISQDPDVRDIAESYDWYIVPSVNPDGYEYTHTHNRLWRKTRSRNNGPCVGADANRNWDFHWNQNGTTGPCYLHYAGIAPFSEPEMKSLSEYITSIAGNLVAYLCFHSFGQKLLLPYSFGEYPENYDELMEIGEKVAASLRNRHGKKYTVGNWAENLYVSSGVSMDWVKAVQNVPIAYTYELRDRGIPYGFLLPASQIIPTGEEVMDSIVTMIREIRARGY